MAPTEGYIFANKNPIAERNTLNLGTNYFLIFFFNFLKGSSSSKFWNRRKLWPPEKTIANTFQTIKGDTSNDCIFNLFLYL